MDLPEPAGPGHGGVRYVVLERRPDPLSRFVTVHGSLHKRLLARRLSAGRACSGWSSGSDGCGHATESEGGERRRRHAREQLDLLSEREREVAVAIGHGKSNAEISSELYMSIATVKAHVSRLLEKLEFNNRVQIALLAHDAGEA